MQQLCGRARTSKQRMRSSTCAHVSRSPCAPDSCLLGQGEAEASWASQHRLVLIPPSRWSTAVVSER